jgi:hypothetical protein
MPCLRNTSAHSVVSSCGWRCLCSLPTSLKRSMALGSSSTRWLPATTTASVKVVVGRSVELGRTADLLHGGRLFFEARIPVLADGRKRRGLDKRGPPGTRGPLGAIKGTLTEDTGSLGSPACRWGLEPRQRGPPSSL